MGQKVERCLRDVLADHERQGGFDEDDLYRLVMAHRLDADEVAELRQLLLDRGVLDRPMGSTDDDFDRDAAASGDAVGALLQRASRTRLLSADEEVQLGRRIALGLAAEARVTRARSRGASSGKASERAST